MVCSFFVCEFFRASTFELRGPRPAAGAAPAGPRHQPPGRGTRHLTREARGRGAGRRARPPRRRPPAGGDPIICAIYSNRSYTNDLINKRCVMTRCEGAGPLARWSLRPWERQSRHELQVQHAVTPHARRLARRVCAPGGCALLPSLHCSCSLEAALQVRQASKCTQCTKLTVAPLGLLGLGLVIPAKG